MFLFAFPPEITFDTKGLLERFASFTLERRQVWEKMPNPDPGSEFEGTITEVIFSRILFLFYLQASLKKIKLCPTPLLNTFFNLNDKYFLSPA